MADSDEIFEHARGNTDFRERPATSACQINPTGLVLWRCHTHGSPAPRHAPCLAGRRRSAHLGEPGHSGQVEQGVPVKAPRRMS